MVFRWTPRRDRDLVAAIEDHFTFREAANMVGSGCTEQDARARIKMLQPARSKGMTADQACVSAVREMEEAKAARTAHVTPRPVLGGPVVGGMAPAAPRALLDLPRYGEMEKTYDPVTRRALEGGQ